MRRSQLHYSASSFRRAILLTRVRSVACQTYQRGRCRRIGPATQNDSVAFFDHAIRTAPVRRASEERGQRLVRFVNDSLYRHDLSLTLAADQIGASSPHTSRLFREMAGIPFQDYVAQHRVERARNLLLTTHRTVQEIGSEVGYGEVHSFIRTFRKRTGTTPAEYRRTAVASTSS